jgi:3-oxoacyl-[acyl-carrier protein] reductase
MGEFVGKVALVTGAGEGIGRALALAFEEQGAIVAANALTPVNLDETIARIHASGGQSQAYVADIASKLAMQSMLNEITDHYGHLDILVQAASVDPPDLLLAMDEWDWRRTLDCNLTGPFLLMQSAGRIMREQGGGVIVNLVCMDGKSSAASAGKSGLLALTQAAAPEFDLYNIRVNAVSSGLSGGDQPSGFPDDPVDLVLYLCSGETSAIHGEIIPFKAVK